MEKLWVEGLKKAQKQFMLDCNIKEAKKVNENYLLAPYKKRIGMRIHKDQDLCFRAIMFMGNGYVMAKPAFLDMSEEIFMNVKPEWWCDFKVLRRLDIQLREQKKEIMDTHIYFLPSNHIEETVQITNTRWLEKDEILHFTPFREDNSYSSAICFSKTQPDILAVVAMDGENVMGVAGASEDGKYLWQIGVNVNSKYQGKGIATNLVKLMKEEIIRRGKVPYYGTSESHSVSRAIAITSGFLPAWAEINAGKYW